MALQALGEATGKSPAQIKKMYEQEGDLGVVAATARSKQNTLFKPKALTLRAVFKYVHPPCFGKYFYLPNLQRTALCASPTLIDSLAPIWWSGLSAHGTSGVHLGQQGLYGGVLRGCCLRRPFNTAVLPHTSLLITHCMPQDVPTDRHH